MAKQRDSGISWTDETWNPLRGCSRVSEGCRNCYAETVASRFNGAGQPYEGLVQRTTQGPKWTGAIRLLPDLLDQPLRWTRPRRIFVNSMSDLFHEAVLDDFIDRVFAVMALSPQHTFQILTKRAERMQRYLNTPLLQARVAALMNFPTWVAMPMGRAFERFARGWPLPNVWLGVSVENQAASDERIPLLLHTPAAIRWISAEPLLGRISLAEHGLHGGPGQLDWVVCGGESGRGARPMHPDWVRSLRDQCASAGVAFHFKQWGEWVDHDQPGVDMVGTADSPIHMWPGGPASVRIGKRAAGRSLDHATHDSYPGSSDPRVGR